MIYFLLFSVLAAASTTAVTSTDNGGQLLNFNNDKCTTIAVGPKAGSMGPMNTHTSDCSDCDFRISKVPARDWPAGSKRPLYLYKSNYPLNVIPNRGPTWLADNLEGTPEQLSVWSVETPTTGFVPQVSEHM